MGAPKNNSYHKGITGEGQGCPRIYNTPEAYKTDIQRYFDWCDKNPLMKNEALKSGLDAGRVIQIPTQRPYLIEGLCDFLNISIQTFMNYESKEGYNDFFEVSAWARNKIYTQNLSYGYVGAFDAGLVARKLGIADKKELEANIKATEIIVRNEDEKSVLEDLINRE